MAGTIKFILPGFVSYLGERGLLCVGNGSHFWAPVLMSMSNINIYLYIQNITFQGLRLCTFVFNKCSEIIIFTVIRVVKSIIRAYWVLVGMLAQRRRRWPNIISQLGQCIWVVTFLTTGDEIITPIQ